MIKFISFEGIDGCGKTTQVELLCKYFDNKNIDYLLVREPGATLLGEKIRDILLNNDLCEIDNISELYMYCAARRQLIKEKIIPAIKSGKIVICDRFLDSTTAYQGFGRGISLEIIDDIHKITTNNYEYIPDITFYLKIDENKSKNRVDSRGHVKNRIENEESSFFIKTALGFDEIAKNNEDRIKTISAELDMQTIHLEIIKYLQND